MYHGVIDLVYSTTGYVPQSTYYGSVDLVLQGTHRAVGYALQGTYHGGVDLPGLDFVFGAAGYAPRWC